MAPAPHYEHGAGNSVNRLLGIVPTTVLLPLLAGILVVSSIKVWFHAK